MFVPPLLSFGCLPSSLFSLFPNSPLLRPHRLRELLDPEHISVSYRKALSPLHDRHSCRGYWLDGSVIFHLTWVWTLTIFPLSLSASFSSVGDMLRLWATDYQSLTSGTSQVPHKGVLPHSRGVCFFFLRFLFIFNCVYIVVFLWLFSMWLKMPLEAWGIKYPWSWSCRWWATWLGTVNQTWVLQRSVNF